MQESLYDIVNTRRDRLLNRGFDYKDQIFNRSLSPFILSDSRRRGILLQFESLLYFLIQKVRLIKAHNNYTVNKDYKNLY